MTARRGVVAAAIALLAASAAAAGAWRADESVFPHLRHARLFPSCAGCHAAIVDSADVLRASRGVAPAAGRERFPPPEACTECHTWRERPIAPWRAPAARATNLAFSHDAHARAQARALEGAAAGAASQATRADCAACHSAPGETRRMAVEHARPEACMVCHAPGRAHLDEGVPCATCHLSLVAASGLTVARVAALPRPTSHERADFVSTHGRLATAAPTSAQCATCHASESCARCHPNAGALPSIVALGRDARVAALVAGRAAVYPSPSSHASPEWPVEHGRAARAAASTCANCHTQRSCATCHLGAGGASAIARLPAPAPGVGAQGVRLLHAPVVGDSSLAERFRRVDAASRNGASRDGPRSEGPRIDSLRRDSLPSDSAHLVRVHPADFAREHGTAALTRSRSCESCHAQRVCAECHAGEGRRRFHPADFALRHSPAAYGRERDCQSCHNAEAFCRSCHASNGVASRGRRDVAYHDAQPQWLLNHGRAARQGLENCTTCHQQTDCMQCHGSLGMRVSPHGPGFDAKRLSSRAKTMCLNCHPNGPPATR